MPVTNADRRIAVLALFFLSGCAGLIYEVVWTRELIFVFGGTTYAITTILVGFMSGLGLGSCVAGRLSGRLRRPGRVYGLLEIAVGAYALLVPTLLHVAEPAYRAMYPRLMEAPALLTAARFCIGFLVLLLPTTCMGATLPILVRHVTAGGDGFGRSVGLLYGINTLGATFGTMAAGFWLIPTFGLTHTTWAAAALNLAVGTAAIVLLGS
ncbi:MAG: fused MFS/spermidine synthase, partial [Phycisphaerae bacterium]